MRCGAVKNICQAKRGITRKRELKPESTNKLLRFKASRPKSTIKKIRS